MSTPHGRELLDTLIEALAELDAACGDDRVNFRAVLDGDLERLRADPNNPAHWMPVYQDAAAMFENAIGVARPETVRYYRNLKRAAGDGVVESSVNYRR